VIKDPYFNFWFRFIYPNRIDLEAMRYDQVLSTINSEFNQYSGTMFEHLMLEIMKKKDVLRNVSFTKIGRWWWKDKEIDIVALNEQTKQILFAECKWKSRVNAEKILQELREKAEFVQWNNGKRKEYFAIFAKSFKEKDIKGVKLYDLKDLERIMKRKN
jgi:AAA+ ATPase superfamily predicted ATPase